MRVMKRLAAATVLLLFGCAAERSKTQTTDATQPHTCAMQVNLTGGSSGPKSVGPLTLDANGASFCAHLDATQLTRAHFAASTEHRMGATSGFATTLEHPDFTTIADGADITVGESPQLTFQQVEWGPPSGTATDVVLWVRAVGTSATTSISLDLFDPLD
jgi:hypothetical protein